ncbi:sugar ABC transporter substrate-binding protein [Kribbella pittospori]|uniref:Sugar ABC transporter substrate-binding protein n=1 Tax=Kribbella pittospori TaxID=722689 RepID=A0A4R0KS44_9ACTN|nr:sugar ABC transporter substrate-binding protein [Kribbella pittospori]TCC62264.1 sugar ABC transporter substrate-binding protein [Kribbella pittospori]
MSWQRTGTLAVAAVTALCLLAACGGGGGDVAAPKDGEEISGTITVRAYPLSPTADEKADKAFWDAQAAAFKAKYPKADVKIDIKPWKDRDTALTTAIAGGTAPDVVYMIPDELAQFRSQDVVEPLNDAVKTDGYRQSALDAVSYDGKVYGAPILMSVVPGVCDAKVLKEVGVDKPPATWDDLVALGPRFKAKGKYVTHIIGSTEATLNTSFYPWVWQAGGAPFDDAGKPTLDSPAMVEAAKFLGDLAAQGYVKRDEAAGNAPVEQTVVGRRQVGCVYYATATELSQVWGKDVVVAPPLKHKNQATYGTVGSFAILKGSKNKALAAAWAGFVTSDEQLAAIGKFSNFYPPKQGAPAPFAAGSNEAQAAAYLSMVNVGPRVAHAREVQGVLAPEIQAVVLGKKPAEQAIKDAAKAAEPVLAH